MISPDEYRTRVQAAFQHHCMAASMGDMEIPPGWLPIFEKLLAYVASEPGLADAYWSRVQNKEGGGWYIHFWSDAHDHIAADAITAAEQASDCACVACGNPGRERQYGVFPQAKNIIVCDAHASPATFDLLAPYWNILQEEYRMSLMAQQAVTP